MQTSLALFFSLHLVFQMCLQCHTQDEMKKTLILCGKEYTLILENDRNIQAFCSEQVSPQILQTLLTPSQAKANMQHKHLLGVLFI